MTHEQFYEDPMTIYNEYMGRITLWIEFPYFRTTTTLVQTNPNASCFQSKVLANQHANFADAAALFDEHSRQTYTSNYTQALCRIPKSFTTVCTTQLWHTEKCVYVCVCVCMIVYQRCVCVHTGSNLLASDCLYTCSAKPMQRKK